jgi:DNA end-binding protein Ku
MKRPTTAPSRGGAKVYALLRETLRKAGKIGIATVVMRTKQHLCALVCVEDKIVLNTLRYATEIRDAEELKLPPKTLKAAGISDKELQMALSLVEGMSEEWKPEQYHDTYKEDVLALVKKKIKAGQTKTITAPDKEAAAPKASNVVDLVALLQDSLGKRGKPRQSAPRTRKKKRHRKSAAPSPPPHAVPAAQAKPPPRCAPDQIRHAPRRRKRRSFTILASAGARQLHQLHGGRAALA